VEVNFRAVLRQLIRPAFLTEHKASTKIFHSQLSIVDFLQETLAERFSEVNWQK
jgi:hypothetical protein